MSDGMWNKMANLEKVIKGLEETEIMLKQAVDRGGEMAVMGAFKCYNHVSDVIALLKEQEIMSPDEFKEKILGMFSSIWDCEIDHPVFQDKVGELMDAVVALYRKAVKWQ